MTGSLGCPCVLILMVSSIFFSGEILLKIGCLAAEPLPGLADPSVREGGPCLESAVPAPSVLALYRESLEDFPTCSSCRDGCLLPDRLSGLGLCDSFDEDLDWPRFLAVFLCGLFLVIYIASARSSRGLARWCVLLNCFSAWKPG